jgi:hypothetical protein
MVLEILTYALARSGFCAPHLPTEALQLAILATLFNRLSLYHSPSAASGAAL